MSSLKNSQTQAGNTKFSGFNNNAITKTVSTKIKGGGDGDIFITEDCIDM